MTKNPSSFFGTEATAISQFPRKGWGSGEQRMVALLIPKTKFLLRWYLTIAPVMRYEMTLVHVLMFISFLNLTSINTLRTKIKVRFCTGLSMI